MGLEVRKDHSKWEYIIVGWDGLEKKQLREGEKSLSTTEAYNRMGEKGWKLVDVDEELDAWTFVRRKR